MEEKKQEQQYYVDVITAALERTIKRLWITILVLAALLAATNAGWIWYESQFVKEVNESYMAETDAGGTAVVNRDGEVNFGESGLQENG